ncbi:hypothetical protein J2X06_003281 [Lysobacter niastensis]|uniref:Uncharacterized protein n=1 Tax=Lysobacter niastensis TaxID=380629 RepID=A0ABU1WEM2_9GAMM|nr:hypothetical protein [Lysobacter niastensis]
MPTIRHATCDYIRWDVILAEAGIHFGFAFACVREAKEQKQNGSQLPLG